MNQSLFDSWKIKVLLSFSCVFMCIENIEQFNLSKMSETDAETSRNHLKQNSTVTQCNIAIPHLNKT